MGNFFARPEDPDPDSSLSHIPSQHATKPQIFHVLPTIRPVLDMSSTSTSPESNTKRALLSDDPNKNSIALVGMGGAGKTTIMSALGMDKDIWAKYADVVWFIELGHDVTISSFIPQLQRLVKSACPDYLEEFKERAASKDSYRSMIIGLMNHLASKRLLLLFDDLWENNDTLYRLVCAMCESVQANESTSLKVLTSTRSRDIADGRPFDSCIAVNPEYLNPHKSFGIFCNYARIDPSNLPSFSTHNRGALDDILKTCAGLPLALSVAGSAVKQLMDPDRCDQNAISEFWNILKTKRGELASAESGDGYKGLTYAVETSLQFVQDKWESKKNTAELCDHLTARDMFQSLCIMQKQMFLPVSVIEKLWVCKMCGLV